MRRFLFASVLLLAACGDTHAAVTQSSTGDLSPNVVAGGNATVNQDVKVQLSKEAEDKLLQSLIDKGVPVADRAAELEALKRKYEDLQQRLGGYAKTDELAQQARKELDAGNLEQAETLLQQAYDKDLQLSKQRLAERAFDLAEVAELRLDHDKALARYREVTQHQPDNLQAWRHVAEISQKLGNTTQALEAWRGMQQAAQTQHQERELAIALSGEADIIMASGDTSAAKEKYLQAHESMKRFAAAEPDNTERQHDLSVSYDRIGDLYKAKGDMASALKSYQDSLGIRQTLVALDPKQTEWQRDLSLSYIRMGDLYKAKGDTASALKSYQDSLAIAQTLAQLDPKQTEWQRDLSVSYNKVGDLYLVNGDTGSALKSYQDSLAIAQTLAALDPKQTDWQRDLSVNYDRIGDLYLAKGDTASALKSYQDSLGIRQTLASLDRKQTQWQRDLSVSYIKVGDLYLAKGDTASALKSYQDSLAIAQTLAALDPKQVEWQTDVVASYYRMAKLQPDKTKEFMGKSLDILQKLHDAGHLPKDWEQWLETTKQRLK